MTYEIATILLLASLLAVLFFVYIIRLFLGINRRKQVLEEKDPGQVGFVVDTFHDLVTKLKEKERELESLKSNAEEKASSIEIYSENIIQSVPSGVVSFDQGLRITKANTAAGRILGIMLTEITGKRYDEVFRSPIKEIIESRKTLQRGEFSYVTHTGKRIWLGLTISPLMDSTGNAIGQILVFTDLTDLKAYQSQTELRERLSNLGEMSAGIAHELRNPMAVISGYTKILSKKADDSIKPAVESISKEVKTMDRIISDFLSFAKPAEPSISRINLKNLLEECIDALGEQKEEMEISLESDQHIYISGDEIMLRQAIVNLLENAVDSMQGSGKLVINTDKDEYVNIVISDRGHGIPENIRDKIFLPFYTTKEHGTGLGLSIVHKIIVSHNGKIHFESSEKGTTFKIRLTKETAEV